MAESLSFGRRHALAIAASGVVAGGAMAVGRWMAVRRARDLYEVRHERTLMQTSVAVTALADSEDAARQAITASFDRMTTVAQLLNRFDASSPVARLNRTGVLTGPPRHLTKVLRRAVALSEASDGDFDITVQPVIDYFLSLSRPVRLTPRLRAAIADRESRVGYRSVAVSDSEVRLNRPGVGITLDGIAKGYVVDQGIAALRAHGIEDGLIDAGGDLRAISRPDGKRFWNIGIVDPLHTTQVAAAIRVSNAALSTSGNYEVFFSADRRLFHIINPHTGYSPDSYSSVTVVAPEAVKSNSASVAVFSLSLARTRDLMKSRGNEWLVFSWDGTARWCSKGLPLVAGEARVL